jgi:hypothetical protein
MRLTPKKRKRFAMPGIPEELRIVSTGKDPRTGRIVTQEYRVEGAVTITTTAAKEARPCR